MTYLDKTMTEIKGKIMLAYDYLKNADTEEDAEKHTRWRVEVYSDSELVIKQINKEYRIKKEHLSKLCDKVYSLR